MTLSKDKMKRLDMGISEVIKRFGSAALVRMDGEGTYEVVPAFSTGSITLDIATGIGGFPRGRITEIAGPDGAGKTTLAVQTIASAQRKGEAAAYIDAEHSFDPKYARKLGLDPSGMAFSQPSCGEEAFEITDMIIRRESVGIAVIDSIAMMMPRAEVEGKIGDSVPGGRARLVSQAMGKLAATVRQSDVALIVINQLREKMGGMPSYGPTETTTGGRMLRHIASLRIDVRRRMMLKAGDKPIGARTKFKVIKSKFSAPMQTGEFDLIFGEGVSQEAEILDLGVLSGVLKKDGITYVWDGERLPGRGRDATRLALREDRGLAYKIEQQVRKALLKLPMESDEGEEP